jgi:hypothetical protein
VLVQYQSSCIFCVHCMWALLHCIQNSTFKQWLLMFRIHAWDGTSLPQNMMHILKCVPVWNSTTWITVLVFCWCSSTISIAETMYKMHAGILYIVGSPLQADWESKQLQWCKTVTLLNTIKVTAHYTNTPTQTYSSLSSIMVMNEAMVYRTFIAPTDK